MGIKKTGGHHQEIEIITDQHDLYLHRDKSGFTLDVFNSKVKDDDQAYEGGESYDDFEALAEVLSSYGVSKEDIVAVKNAWRLF
jgi:hypothetical protein